MATSTLQQDKHVQILNNKLVVRVNLLDNSQTVLLLDPTASVQDVVTATCVKMEMPDDPDLYLNFALHECLDGVTISRQLGATTPVQSVMQKWPDGGTPKLVFQVKLYSEGLLNTKSPEVANLLYIQAVYHVILGMYQLPQEDAIRAGALQVFVKFGAHDASKHKPGFLSKTLLEYIPGTIIRSKPPEEWETEIFAVHEKLTCTDKNEARQQYLDLCGKLDYYGCSLFAVRQMFDKKMARNLVLGVNYAGIILLKPGDLKKTFTMTTLMKHSLNDIYRWAYKPKLNFYFEVKPEEDEDQNPVYTFATVEGKDIADLLTDYAMGMLRDMGLNPDGTKREKPGDDGDDDDDDVADAAGGGGAGGAAGAGTDGAGGGDAGEVGDDSDLPEDWTRVVDEDSGGVYYYNNMTGESSWEKPTE